MRVSTLLGNKVKRLIHSCNRFPLIAISFSGVEQDMLPAEDVVWGAYAFLACIMMSNMLIMATGVAFTIDPAHVAEVRDNLSTSPSVFGSPADDSMSDNRETVCSFTFLASGHHVRCW